VLTGLKPVRFASTPLRGASGLTPAPREVPSALIAGPDTATSCGRPVTQIAPVSSDRQHRWAISGGKSLKKRRNGLGANRIAGVLRLAATSLQRSRTALGASFRRIARHKGGAVAVFATARQLARLIYRMLRYGQDYVDIGEKAYERPRASATPWCQTLLRGKFQVTGRRTRVRLAPNYSPRQSFGSAALDTHSRRSSATAHVRVGRRGLEKST
jgi:hypothetical protein